MAAPPLRQAARILVGGDPGQAQAELKLFRNSAGLFARHPEASTGASLDRVSAQLVQGEDSQTALLALEAASRLPIGEEWRRTHGLPLTSSTHSWKLGLAVAKPLPCNLPTSGPELAASFDKSPNEGYRTKVPDRRHL